jgi:chemotaxis signal transduction protein
LVRRRSPPSGEVLRAEPAAGITKTAIARVPRIPALVRGMGKCDPRFVIILDIEKVFSGGEPSLVQEAGAPAS